MNRVFNPLLPFAFALLLLVSSCGKSTYSTFSKPGESYKSAQEIAELKKAERQQRRLARKSGLLSPTEKKQMAVKSKERVKQKTSAVGIADKNIQKVISTARSYRGTPYKFGGTTRIGMDCSGLLCTSFQAIDVQLPRTSGEQSHFGPSVSTRDLKAGDLVFFSSSKNVNNITHVGMVTEVKSDNEIYFIHASTSLGVTEDNLYAPYYQRIFVKAVRPKI